MQEQGRSCRAASKSEKTTSVCIGATGTVGSRNVLTKGWVRFGRYSVAPQLEYGMKRARLDSVDAFWTTPFGRSTFYPQGPAVDGMEWSLKDVLCDPFHSIFFFSDV